MRALYNKLVSLDEEHEDANQVMMDAQERLEKAKSIHASKQNEYKQLSEAYMSRDVNMEIEYEENKTKLIAMKALMDVSVLEVESDAVHVEWRDGRVLRIEMGDKGRVEGAAWAHGKEGRVEAVPGIWLDAANRPGRGVGWLIRSLDSLSRHQP